jgi:hypothetical protein
MVAARTMRAMASGGETEGTRMTLGRHILESQRQHRRARGELSTILTHEDIVSMRHLRVAISTRRIESCRASLFMSRHIAPSPAG